MVHGHRDITPATDTPSYRHVIRDVFTPQRHVICVPHDLTNANSASDSRDGALATN